MQRDIVTRRVMTKFTQIPQSSEELRICFNKDTRRNGIMTSLGLLVALGNIAQAIIRIYLLAFNKRLSIATGIHRIAARQSVLTDLLLELNAVVANYPGIAVLVI
jgi:hypothetical protein